MTTRTFALIFGIAYLGAGLLGLMPGLLTPMPADAPPTRFDVMQGELLGLFPVNMLHTAVHLAIGAWGLMAFMGWLGTRTYARSLAVIYAVLGIMGLVPALDTMFGLTPLYGHDVWLHLGTAAVAAFFGFAAREQESGARERAAERRALAGDRRKASRSPVRNDRRQGPYDRRGMAT
ncbi:MAG: hypothetical protein A3G81_10315 [Betaproteobacteria bacterium RIFCSPLOWO2_12_FULL_65_14]|nr:MAG: hypothetical protein A3G81_10315 [Betaproteobacteria bacterium RIFCSPLOWO2_12_FULL_65_14]